jgi:sugar (pentulose or hexulose) kinase
MYKTLEEAAEDIVHLRQEITPDDETVKIYDRCYETWREWYAKLAEM